MKSEIKEVWSLATPAIVGQLAKTAMSFIDTGMVGHLGANAAAAVGLIVPITWITGGIVESFGTGFAVQIAHSVGAGDDAKARNVLKHALIVGTVLSLVLTLVCLGVSGHVPIWLGADAEICADATWYFVAYLAALPVQYLYWLVRQCLHSRGDMKTPSVMSVLMCVLDVVFNAMFIPKYGAAGAGIGTSLAYAVVCLVLLHRCCVKDEKLRLTYKEKYKYSGEVIGNATKIGIPLAFNAFVADGASVMLVRLLAPFGAVAMAAHTISTTARRVTYAPAYGVESAAAGLVGRTIGAGNATLARKYGMASVLLRCSIVTMLSAVMFVICPWVIKLLTPDTAVQEMALFYVRLLLVVYPMRGVIIASWGVLTGLGDTVYPSVAEGITLWVVTIGLALLLREPLGAYGVWIAQAVEVVVRGAILLYRQKTSPYYEGN